MSDNQNLHKRITDLEALLEEYKSTNNSLAQDIERLEREVQQKSGYVQGDLSLSEEHSVDIPSPQKWQELLAVVGRVQERCVELEGGEDAADVKESIRNSDTQAAALKSSESVNAGHITRIEALEQTLFELRGEMGGGRHIPPNTRVVCLRQNPAQHWADTRKEVLDRLKQENEALLRRLEELESKVTIGQTGAIEGDVDMDVEHPARTEMGGRFVPRESYESMKEEKKELEEIVKQKEKRLLRLQQVCIPFFADMFVVFLTRPLLYMYRYSLQNLPNSVKQSLQSLVSNLRSIQMGRSASLQCSILALPLSSSPPQTPRVVPEVTPLWLQVEICVCSWLVREKAALRTCRS